MGVRPGVLRQLGWRPAVMALACAVAVGGVALLLVLWFGPSNVSH
jgi:hypothetical protein